MATVLSLKLIISAVLFIEIGDHLTGDGGNRPEPKPSTETRRTDESPPRLPFEPEMVRIPGGTFVMGSPVSELGHISSEGPRHRVRIAAFEVSKYEVTWDQWEACVRANGCDGSGPQKAGDDNGWGKGNRPVIQVSWNDAQAYVSWLRRKTGKAYRLLSEAEWEYAARAGTTTRYSWGGHEPVCDQNARNGANFRECTDDRTRPVGSFRANAFGLHDMHGNIWEWVEDCWHSSYAGAPTDGSAWTTGCFDSRRVLRGSSWSGSPQSLRSAYRGWNFPGVRSDGTGFRVARTL